VKMYIPFKFYHVFNQHYDAGHFTGALVQFCLFISEPKKKGKRKKKKKGSNGGGAGESQGSPEEGEPGMSVCHSCA